RQDERSQTGGDGKKPFRPRVDRGVFAEPRLSSERGNARVRAKRRLVLERDSCLERGVGPRLPDGAAADSLGLVPVAVVGAREQGEDRVLIRPDDPLVLARRPEIDVPADPDPASIAQGKLEPRGTEGALAREGVPALHIEERRRIALAAKGDPNLGRRS